MGPPRHRRHRLGRRPRVRRQRARAASASACSSRSPATWPPARRSRPTAAEMDFELTDEQRLLRDTVREFARDEVAPVAEELDRTKSFPYELVAQAGRARADGDPVPGASTAAAVPTRSPTRSRSRSWPGSTPRSASRWPPTPRWGRCRSTSGAATSSSSEWLPALCAGERLAAFGLTEPEAGSDAGDDPHPGAPRRRRVGDRRREAVHHQLRDRDLRLRDDHRLTGDDGGRREISNLIVPNGTPGYEPGEPYRKMGWNASDTRPLTFDRLPGPGGEPARPARRGLQELPPHPRRRPDRRRRDGGRARAGGARRGDRLREGAARLRSADLEVPGDPGEDRRPLGARSRRPGCSPTARRCRRTAASRSRSPPPRRS